MVAGAFVSFVCFVSVAFPKFGRRSTADRPSVALVMDGKTHTQHTHESNHNIVATIYTTRKANSTTKQKAMGRPLAVANLID